MMNGWTRRDFLRWAAAAGTVAMFVLASPGFCDTGKPATSQPSSRIVAYADGTIEWTCIPAPAACSCTLSTSAGQAVLAQDKNGATLTLAGKKLMHVRGIVRVKTTKQGQLAALISIHTKKVNVGITGENGKTEEFALAPGTTIPIKQ